MKADEGIILCLSRRFVGVPITCSPESVIDCYFKLTESKDPKKSRNARAKSTHKRRTTMLAFLTIIFVILSWIPTIYAVTATTWGAIRYFSSNGCQPSSLLYIESFPLNVCYKTGNLPYYKMNTVTKGGTIGCSSCWQYTRQQYSDASCSIPRTNAYSMVYRDTSTSCGLLIGVSNIYARYFTATIPIMTNTQPPASHNLYPSKS